MNKTATEAMQTLAENLVLLDLLAHQELQAAREIEQNQHAPLFPEWRSFPTE